MFYMLELLLLIMKLMFISLLLEVHYICREDDSVVQNDVSDKLMICAEIVDTFVQCLLRVGGFSQLLP